LKKKQKYKIRFLFFFDWDPILLGLLHFNLQNHFIISFSLLGKQVRNNCPKIHYERTNPMKGKNKSGEGGIRSRKTNANLFSISPFKLTKNVNRQLFNEYTRLIFFSIPSLKDEL
jgi:hypothetical protein